MRRSGRVRSRAGTLGVHGRVAAAVIASSVLIGACTPPGGTADLFSRLPGMALPARAPQMPPETQWRAHSLLGDLTTDFTLYPSVGDETATSLALVHDPLLGWILRPLYGDALAPGGELSLPAGTGLPALLELPGSLSEIGNRAAPLPFSPFGFAPAAPLSLSPRPVTAPSAPAAPASAAALSTGRAPAVVIRPGGPAPITGPEILANAKRLLNVPYVWGGNSESGLDCSAYVSKAWGVGRYTTDSIQAVSFKISRDELLPGDILNLTTREDPRGYGHVRLFAGWANAERTRMWVYEETPPRSLFHVIAYDAAYTPLRRVNYVPDAEMAAALESALAASPVAGAGSTGGGAGSRSGNTTGAGTPRSNGAQGTSARSNPTILGVLGDAATRVAEALGVPGPGGSKNDSKKDHKRKDSGPPPRPTQPGWILENPPSLEVSSASAPSSTPAPRSEPPLAAGTRQPTHQPTQRPSAPPTQEPQRPQPSPTATQQARLQPSPTPTTAQRGTSRAITQSQQPTPQPEQRLVTSNRPAQPTAIPTQQPTRAPRQAVTQPTAQPTQPPPPPPPPPPAQSAPSESDEQPRGRQPGNGNGSGNQRSTTAQQSQPARATQPPAPPPPQPTQPPRPTQAPPPPTQPPAPTAARSQPVQSAPAAQPAQPNNGQGQQKKAANQPVPQPTARATTAPAQSRSNGNGNGGNSGNAGTSSASASAKGNGKK